MTEKISVEPEAPVSEEEQTLVERFRNIRDEVQRNDPFDQDDRYDFSGSWSSP